MHRGRINICGTDYLVYRGTFMDHGKHFVTDMIRERSPYVA